MRCELAFAPGLLQVERAGFVLPGNIVKLHLPIGFYQSRIDAEIAHPTLKFEVDVQAAGSGGFVLRCQLADIVGKQ